MNIGEASRASGLTPKMIRYYEASGLVAMPPRTRAGYRQYGEADVRTLRFVRRTRDFGFSVAETARLLRLWQDEGRASGDVKRLTLRHAASLEARAGELMAASRRLRHLAEQCEGGAEAPCPIIDELARVEAAPPSHPGAEDRR